MKRNALIVSVVIILIVFAVMIFRYSNHSADASEAAPACISKPLSTNSELNTVSRSIRSAGCVSSNDNVAETQSVRVISGGSSVVEIDHGLPKQLVDTPEMRHGVDYGLNGAITLRVVDSTGTSVRGATVKGAFGNQWEPKSKRRFEVDTDAHGIVALANKCSGDLNFSISKDGYYDSIFRYWFFKNGYDCAKDGHWLPWNPTVEVTLKEKRNPVRMLMNQVDTPVPVHGEPVGFDFEKGDWVVPFGNGEHSDMQVSYKRTVDEETNRVCNDLLILFTNAMDGAYLSAKDEYSEFKSAYEADPKAVYLNEYQFVSEGVPGKILRNVKMGGNEMMIFRVRTELGADGKVSKAHHGVIYGPIQFAQGRTRSVRFFYIFNPTMDDQNLEYEALR